MIDRLVVPALLAVIKALGGLYWFAWRRWRPQPARDALVYRLGRRRPPCGGPFCDGCDECGPSGRSGPGARRLRTPRPR